MPSFHPPREHFTATQTAGKAQVVWMSCVMDMETPLAALARHLAENSNAPCFLLESVEGGEVRGRYSILGLAPDLVWECRGDTARIIRHPGTPEESTRPCTEPPLSALKKLVRQHQFAVPPELPPMAGGLIGHLGYDMVRHMERLPDVNADTLDIPDATLMRPTVMIVFDSVASKVYLMAPVWADTPVHYETATERLENALVQLRTPLAASVIDSATPAPSPCPSSHFTSNRTREQYHAMVERAKAYIRAGDIFQIVPSQRFQAPFTLPPLALYRSLRHLNPSPFLFYLQCRGYTLIGSSPEILVRLRRGVVTIRPIAGTRPRGATPEEDATLEAGLLADPKECAEHLMLLDLGRNDVGRVAETGSVQVTEQAIVERYSHVMHIVSNVQGRLREGCDAVDALAAGFPAGTVSGAPKIRAMEIIDELESEKRGFYAGAVGYFSATGDMDTCIALRTGLIKDDMLYVQAGGGVVADSDPEAEYQESCNKARALMAAAAMAERFA